jgi:DNA-binding response OmpR family regulator
VVEDDPIIALDLKTMLEDAAAVVTGPAADLATALRLAEQHAHDAAVLDGGLNGKALCRLPHYYLNGGYPSYFRPATHGW